MRGVRWNEALTNPPYLSGRSSYIEDDDAPLIGQMFPQVEIATLPEAGHWVHVDAPDEFFQTVMNFLKKTWRLVLGGLEKLTPSQWRDRRYEREFRQVLGLQPERLRILIRVGVLLRLG